MRGVWVDSYTFDGGIPHELEEASLCDPIVHLLVIAEDLKDKLHVLLEVCVEELFHCLVVGLDLDWDPEIVLKVRCKEVGDVLSYRALVPFFKEGLELCHISEPLLWHNLLKMLDVSRVCVVELDILLAKGLCLCGLLLLTFRAPSIAIIVRVLL